MGGLPSQPVQQNRVARDTNFDSAIGVCEQFGSIGRWLFIRVFSVDFAESAAWRFRVCALTVMVVRGTSSGGCKFACGCPFGDRQLALFNRRSATA